MRIRCIAVDLDGTLLNSSHRVGTRSAAALRAASRVGILVVPATGKAPSSLRGVLPSLGLNGPAICLQGALVTAEGGRLISQTPLPSEVADRTAVWAQRRSKTLVAYCGDHVLAAECNSLTDLMIPYQDPVPQAVGSLPGALASRSVHKLMFIDEPALIPEIRRTLSIELDGWAKLVQSLPNMLEILPLGVSKGSALRTLLEPLGIDAGSLMAIGDAENDLEMMKLAGLPVAMGNASEEVKSAADWVVASNDCDGVGEAVERALAQQPKPAALVQPGP